MGDLYRHPYGRTITDADNVWFTMLTMNTNQVHFNYHFAKKTAFKKPLVNSTFTLALVAGMSVVDVSENAFANLGWGEIKLPNPLFVGDTVYADSEVLSKRESKSRSGVGIVGVRTKGYNQDGKVIINFTRTVMVYKKEHSPRQTLFPEPRLAAKK